MIVSTEAIVMRARKYGDSSKLVSFYTLDEGMITCIAKGSRLPKNKYGSSLESLSMSYITFYKNNSTDLYLLSKADLIESHSNILRDFEKINIGLSILESLAITQVQHDANPEIFSLLKNYLAELNNGKTNIYNYFLKFQLELFSIIGFSIDLSYINILDDDNRQLKYNFNIESGELLNNSNGSSTFTLSKKAADYLIQVNNSDLELLDSVKVEDDYIKTLNTLVSMYLSYHLDRKIYFKTMNIF